MIPDDVSAGPVYGEGARWWVTQKVACRVSVLLHSLKIREIPAVPSKVIGKVLDRVVVFPRRPRLGLIGFALGAG